MEEEPQPVHGWFDLTDPLDMERFDAIVDEMEQQQAPEPNGTAVQ